MTGKTRTKRTPKTDLTMEKMAAMKIKPWQRVEGEKFFVPRDEWDAAQAMLVIGYETLHLTKDELIERLSAVPADKAVEYFEMMDSTVEMMNAIHSAMRSAKARTLCAMAAIAMRDDPAGGQTALESAS